MQHVSKPTIAMIYNSCDHVLKARMKLIAAIQDKGYDVALLSPTDAAKPELEEHGVKHYPLRMSQYGMNPLKEISSYFEITKYLREIRPEVVLAYTIKPNIFGNFAAQRLGVPVLNNIAGAGRLFSSTSAPIATIVQYMFRKALRYSSTVFFQNSDDRREFISKGIVEQNKARLIPGSGVDLQRYKFSLPQDLPRTFLFIGRLLKEKGVKEFISASEIVSKEIHDAKFWIVGEREDHESYVGVGDLQRFEEIKGATYIGAVHPSQMPDLISNSSGVVLPSYYREGVPRVLLEACASGRPIITTDNHGCRDVVRDGINGYKVPIKDSLALSAAMLRFAQSSIDEIEKMSVDARATAEEKFDETFVIDAYLEAISKLKK